MVVPKRMTWKEAMLRCKAENGDLASFENKDEYLRIKNEVQYFEHDWRVLEIARLSKTD